MIKLLIHLFIIVFIFVEIRPRVVPVQLSVDGGQHVRLDLHNSRHHRALRQHSLPRQNYVGESVSLPIGYIGSRT